MDDIDDEEEEIPGDSGFASLKYSNTKSPRAKTVNKKNTPKKK